MFVIILILTYSIQTKCVCFILACFLTPMQVSHDSGKGRWFDEVLLMYFVLIQLLSYVQFFGTSWTIACQPSLSSVIFQSFLKLMSTESMTLSNHLILCHSLLHLPLVFPAIRVFSNQLALHIRWPKYWSISFSNIPSNKYSGLISFRIDWLDLLAVQKTLKSLLWHHNLKTSIHWFLAFFVVQISHQYMTPGKTIASTIWILLAKWCLCFLICCLGWSQLFFQGASIF